MTPERKALLRQRLRDGDPLVDGERLSTADAQAIRRQVLAAAPATQRPLTLRFALAALALVATLTGAHLLTPGRGQLGSPPVDVASSPAAGSTSASSTSGGSSGLTDDESRDRQVQFVTRGGTRIIWMLKPRVD